MEARRVLPVLWQVTKLVAVPEVEFLESASSHDVIDAPAQVVVVRSAIGLPQSLLPDRRIVLIDTPLDTLARVVLAELMDADSLLSSRRSDSPVLALRIEAVVVAALTKL